MITRPWRYSTWVLLANALPGVYRVVSVFVLTSLLNPNASNEFSRQFFWLGFAASITALPLASICYSKNYLPSPAQIAATIAVSSLLCTGLIFLFVPSVPFVSLVILLLVVVLMAVFELERTRLIVDGYFRRTSIILMTSFGLLAPSAILIDDSSGSIALIFFAVPLFLPFAVSGLLRSKSPMSRPSWTILIREFLSFSASNSLSTGLMYLFPLMLMSELGETLSTNVAKVFVLSNVFFLLPRSLCAKALPAIRKGEAKYHDTRRIGFVIVLASAACFTAVLALIALLFSEMLALVPLMVGLLTTQFALPYSNVLMVQGQSTAQLTINIHSSAIFFGLSAIVWLAIEPGTARGIAFCFAFAIANIERARLAARKARQCLE